VWMSHLISLRQCVIALRHVDDWAKVSTCLVVTVVVPVVVVLWGLAFTHTTDIV
jgi:hypothetical protein